MSSIAGVMGLLQRTAFEETSLVDTAGTNGALRGATTHSAEASVPSGYAWALVQMGVTLLAVCLLAWLLLRWARRGGFGVGPAQRRMALLERLPLDPRRALHLVRVGDRVLVIGTGDGAPQLLIELAADEVPDPPPAPQPSFSEVLARLRHPVDKDPATTDE